MGVHFERSVCVAWNSKNKLALGGRDKMVCVMCDV